LFMPLSSSEFVSHFVRLKWFTGLLERLIICMGGSILGLQNHSESHHNWIAQLLFNCSERSSFGSSILHPAFEPKLGFVSQPMCASFVGWLVDWLFVYFTTLYQLLWLCNVDGTVTSEWWIGRDV
jgi:hypothetical protein